MGRGCERGAHDNRRFGQPSGRRFGLVPGGQIVLPRALPAASATLHARVGPTHRRTPFLGLAGRETAVLRQQLTVARVARGFELSNS
jgi:hypothetical protein